MALLIAVILRPVSPSFGLVYNILTCLGSAIGLYVMVEHVDLKDSASCGWWFNHGNLAVGAAIASGLVGEYLASLL